MYFYSVNSIVIVIKKKFPKRDEMGTGSLKPKIKRSVLIEELRFPPILSHKQKDNAI